MVTETTPIKFDLANWTRLAKIGSATAVSGLSLYVNKDLSITTLSIEEVSLRNASGLVGKADQRVIGIYLLFSGNTEGQILLAFKPETAYELIDMAMGINCGSTTELGEMERSVLGEMGNIVGAFFLNGVADCAGLRLMPSPPLVIEGTAGVLIGSVVKKASIGKESLFVIKLKFHSPTKEIEGHFLVLPSIEKS